MFNILQAIFSFLAALVSVFFFIAAIASLFSFFQQKNNLTSEKRYEEQKVIVAKKWRSISFIFYGLTFILAAFYGFRSIFNINLFFSSIEILGVIIICFIVACFFFNLARSKKIS